MREQTPIETTILGDVKARTGLHFVYIGSINVCEKAVADAVLPVLAEWVQVTEDNNHRHALVACFHTPHARKYFDQLITWWLNKHYDLASSSLTHTISFLVTSPNVERVWKVIKDLPVRPFGYMLFAKLASLPSAVQRSTGGKKSDS
jgi:hypothetical protein